MSDIKTRFISFEKGADWLVDFDLAPPDLSSDAGLETAVIISLFTDREAEADDALPDGGADRRGWWGDAYPDAAKDKIGSRLWLLWREKQIREVELRAQEYGQEALDWLVEDGVATAVRVIGRSIRRGVLGLFVEIDRPRRPAARYQFVWESHLNAV